jgi:hypothetical protein
MSSWRSGDFKFCCSVKIQPGATITVRLSDFGHTHEPPYNIVTESEYYSTQQYQWSKLKYHKFLQIFALFVILFQFRHLGKHLCKLTFMILALLTLLSSLCLMAGNGSSYTKLRLSLNGEYAKLHKKNLHILSRPTAYNYCRVWVTIDRVWTGSWISWPLNRS